ncbi:MAG: zonular occludens toxin domain-containing protein [Clostridiales bacterium]|jgi:hypothetical protein|nr:zonular occludens toxin domain-containing protein [Clostridiales bacterium]
MTAIVGKPGTGKTAFMTAWAVLNMTQNAKSDIAASKANIKYLNARYGFNLEIPKDVRHLVYADYNIKHKEYGKKLRERHACNGYYLALPTPPERRGEDYTEPMFLPPFSHVYLDEAQRYFDSDCWERLAPEVKLFYEMHRHNHLDIVYSCQRDTRIAASIRQLVSEVIDIQQVFLHKNRFNGNVSTVWKYLSFPSTEAHETYVKSIDKKAKKRELKTLKIDGNVFKWYNSYDHQDRFFCGFEDRYAFDFDVEDKDGTRPGFFKPDKKK